MKKAHYQVVNSNGQLLQTFGSGVDALHAAKAWVKDNEGCGLRYGLRVVKYFVDVK